MKSAYLLAVIAATSLYLLNPVAGHGQACNDEDSIHTSRVITYFMNDSRFEPDLVESGIQDISIDDITRLSSSSHSELCQQIKRTSLFTNTPPAVPSHISFFKTSDRRFIVHFFLDSLPSDDGLTFHSGPIGIIRILDEDLQHIKSVLVK